MIDLDDLSKEELIALIEAMNSKEGEKPYHPDSLMAMALASPKEARAISWRSLHPLAKLFLFLFLMLAILGIGFILFVAFST